ncbi:hypothetical protein BDZ97DRAFT_1277078 [Flammula alnicola]|nr:hypothetical protein BDZ97DRAFT_1277078 [Flammula alnicola]
MGAWAICFCFKDAMNVRVPLSLQGSMTVDNTLQSGWQKKFHGIGEWKEHLSLKITTQNLCLFPHCCSRLIFFMPFILCACDVPFLYLILLHFLFLRTVLLFFPLSLFFIRMCLL